ncbi:MAG TPA: DUF3500 domain-containing protein [Polyangiaceae bacterium]|nr:DUF3500 domain-containing protein [Polyangiaceae bacterium]
MISIVSPLALLLPGLLFATPLGMVVAAAGGVAVAGAPSASRAALLLQQSTAAGARKQLDQPFSDAARSDWHYVPRSRAGIAWRDMNAQQREATTQLLRSALSDAGVDKVHAVMALEIALRELETFGSHRDPGNYALALFGTPGSGEQPWGWRIEGHHLSLHFTLQGDRYLSTLPQFMGANPALVPRDIAKGGPKQGTRVLAQEEDLARQLMAALPERERALALFDQRPYGDIVTRNAQKLDPLTPVGVAWPQLPAAEQALLLRLVRAFAEHLRPELVEQRLERVRAGGLDSLRFGWAGSLTRGEAFYFRIQGATFLIELDNSGGNHIHSVWRDFEGDWGRDVLAEHYRGSAGTGHVHR